MTHEKLRRAIVIGPFEGEPCDEPGFGPLPSALAGTYSNALTHEPITIDTLTKVVKELDDLPKPRLSRRWAGIDYGFSDSATAAWYYKP